MSVTAAKCKIIFLSTLAFSAAVCQLMPLCCLQCNACLYCIFTIAISRKDENKKAWYWIVVKASMCYKYQIRCLMRYAYTVYRKSIMQIGVLVGVAVLMGLADLSMDADKHAISFSQLTVATCISLLCAAL